jgi:phage-related tail fiber protein
MDAGGKQPGLNAEGTAITFDGLSGTGVSGNDRIGTDAFAAAAADTARLIQKNKSQSISLHTALRTDLTASAAVGASYRVIKPSFLSEAYIAQRLSGNVPLIETGHLTGTAAGTFHRVKVQYHGQSSFSIRQRIQR